MKVILLEDVKKVGKKGEIVNVSVDERVLDETGRVDVSKVKPITFDPFNNQYVGLGKVVGRAFKDGLKLK